MKQYFKTHEWIEESSNGAYHIGISEYAARRLGDVVFIEQMEDQSSFIAGDTLMILESVKAVGDVYAPFACEVIRVNEKIVKTPEELTGEEWLLEIKPLDSPLELDSLNDSDYEAYVKKEG
jgi:glycine cleavage system H protein